MSYRLKDFGSFHVGGRQVVASGLPIKMISYTSASPPRPKDENGTYWIEQAYVQYFIPEPRPEVAPGAPREKLPIVFLHGGGLTGQTWETTPDGRPGWLHRFLEWGYPTYVVDLPERGRAGFSVVPNTWEGAPIGRTAEEAWTLFRFGDTAGFATRTAFANCDFPVEALDAFMMQAVPRWTTTRDIHIAAFRAVVERVGPCTIICHSQGGDNSHDIALERPDLVHNYVAVEPSGFALDFGTPDLTGQRYLYVYGDYIAQQAMWRDLDGMARSYADKLRGAGADVTWMDLPEHGLAGATHMIMMDRSSDTSAAMIRDWIETS